MSIVLKNQIEASEKSADELQSEFVREHRRAMFCLDVEDLIRTVVEIHADLTSSVDRWQKVVAEATVDAQELAGLDEGWEQLFRRLNGVFSKTAACVERLEQDGFHDIAGKGQFLSTWRELRGIVSLSLDKVKKGVAELGAGQFRTLDEVGDELQSSPLE